MIGGGNGLGIIDMGYLGMDEILVIVIADLFETIEGALTATGADFFINETWLFSNPGSEPPRLTS